MKKITLKFVDKDSMWDFIEFYLLQNYSANNTTCILQADSLTDDQIETAIIQYLAVQE